MSEEIKQTEELRDDLVELVAPDGQQYTNADHTMIGKKVTCLKGYEDTLSLITDEEAERYKKALEETNNSERTEVVENE